MASGHESLGTMGLLRQCVEVFGRTLVDAILPHTCPRCKDIVSGHQGLCASCFARLSFIDGPVCWRCGLPLAQEPGDDRAPRLCPECLTRRPLYRCARAALLYDEESAPLVLQLKHADRTESVDLFARWMTHAGRSLLTPDCLLIPVPLHWSRLFLRRYNQAGLITRAIASGTGLEADLRGLRRTRRTAPQGRKRRAQRMENVRNAFEAVHPERLKGRAVVLVDDVMTTGATMEACTRTLVAAGVTRVDVLTLARVSPEHRFVRQHGRARGWF
ncbi:ComF family protein [Phaeovibrio sulfidiphilus]|uniref:ComF family protein n=1 Tax=Phaeovibrio sulfidiphilus TaxID=1220600 RepID=A0A8J6YPD7_9PROT|nr:ComF family protein [Phaeovibrio sulfidiphilus]MBE1237136.1 ComF family protein [Phaeovibrio sulfidiphilus]